MTINAASHADQRQNLPLLDALESHVRYIEFDVHLVGDKLLVGHDKKDLTPQKSIQSLYLDPLFKLTKKSWLPDPVYLMVDIKTAGTPSFRKLHSILKAYSPMLTKYENGTLTRRSVQVIVTGNRAKNEIVKQNPRLAFFDGRLPALQENVDPTLMPIVSESWQKAVMGVQRVPRPKNAHKLWYKIRARCQSEEQIQAALKPHVELARNKGVVLRIWGAPSDNPKMWETLRKLDPDTVVLNTDNPRKLHLWVIQQEAP